MRKFGCLQRIFLSSSPVCGHWALNYLIIPRQDKCQLPFFFLLFSVFLHPTLWSYHCVLQLNYAQNSDTNRGPPVCVSIILRVYTVIVHMNVCLLSYLTHAETHVLVFFSHAVLYVCMWCSNIQTDNSVDQIKIHLQGYKYNKEKQLICHFGGYFLSW